MKAGLLGLSVLAVGIGVGSDLAAQTSGYGCRALETHSVLPSVEGKDGTFFRVLPDLQSHHAMGPETIQQVAALSDALATRGTTLVLLPIPGRAQIMAHQLPLMAAHVGYDADLATAVYVRMIADLRAAGVAVADPRQPMRQVALAGIPVFYGSDPRPTPQGTMLMAQAVADVLAQGAAASLERTTFTTTTNNDEELTTLPSPMRAQLQLACQDALPQVQAPITVTQGTVADATPGIVAVLGSQTTATAELNLSGFISEFSGLRAGSYGVAQGGAFAAISSYLTSLDYSQTPADVIVWEVPVSQGLATYGDQPMAELIAAAGQTCTTALPLRRGKDDRMAEANLGGLDAGGHYTLALDTGGAAVPQVRFHFTSADGQTRSRSIYRHKDQILTGRFFMPLSGLEATGLTALTVELPSAFGAAPSLSLCAQGVSQ